LVVDQIPSGLDSHKEAMTLSNQADLQAGEELKRALGTHVTQRVSRIRRAVPALGRSYKE
jgi:hypothetical protein